MDGRFAGNVVHPQALSGGLAIGIGCQDKILGAIAELAGGAFGGQSKYHRRPGDRPVSFILDTNSRFGIDPLAHLRHPAFSLDDYHIQFSRNCFGLLGPHSRREGC